MLILGLNTVGPACDLALVNNAVLVGQRHVAMLRGQDARLPGLVTSVCSDADTDLRSIERIAVVTGPGSFTGIRVGVAFARGLSLALGIPCVGITSLEAMLPAGEQGSALALLPAQRRAPDITFWTQSFLAGRATGAAAEMPLDAVTERLRSMPQMVYGEAAPLLTVLPELVIRTAAPSAARAAELASGVDPARHPPIPTYARAPDALLPGARPAA